MRKKEKLSYLKEYYNFVEEFNNIFDELREYAQNGEFEKVEKCKVALRQINLIVTNLQKKLEAIPNFPDYDSEYGDNCNEVTERLDILARAIYERANDKQKDEEGNRYDNNGLSDTRTIPVEDARKAAEAWGEGYAPLTDFLEICIKNEVPTLGCCSGHEEGDKSYVLFNGSDDRAVGLAEYLSENKECSNVGIFGNVETSQVFIGIYMPMKDRERVYGLACDYINGREIGNNRNEDSLISKMIDIMNDGYFDSYVEYDVLKNQYKIDLGEGDRTFSGEQLEQQLQNDPSGGMLKSRVTIIDRIKERCASVQWGLKDIMPIKALLARAIGDSERANEENEIEK